MAPATAQVLVRLAVPITLAYKNTGLKKEQSNIHSDETVIGRVKIFFLFFYFLEGVRYPLATIQTIRYTNIEKAVAQQVIKKLQKIIDLYLGTDTTQGELLVRNLAIYERNTFRLLLNLHAYMMVYNIEKDLSDWGRQCFTENEIYHIISQVNVYINGWIKQYVIFTNKHPDILVSDIAGKRSKVLIYIDLSQKAWKELQELVDAVYKELLKIYRDYCLYTTEDISVYKEKYPDINFIAVADIQDALFSGVTSVMDVGSYSTDFLNAVVSHATKRLANNTNQLLKYEGLTNNQAGIVREKHQEFIDYLTQQVFSDEGYLYGGARENIQTAITNNSTPGIRDFTNFLLARANTNAYSGLYSSSVGNHIYNDSDMAAVITRNKAVVNDHAIMSYLDMLDKAGALKADDKDIQVAFGYRIPDEDIIKEIYDKVMDKAKEISGCILTSAAATRNITPSDISDWRSQLQEVADTAGEEVASNIPINNEERQNGSTGKGIDASFTEPIADAGLGALVYTVNKGKNNLAGSADVAADEIRREIPDLDQGYNGINVNTKNPIKVSEFPVGTTSYTVVDPNTGAVKTVPVTRSVVTSQSVTKVPEGTVTVNTDTVPATPVTPSTDQETTPDSAPTAPEPSSTDIGLVPSTTQSTPSIIPASAGTAGGVPVSPSSTTPNNPVTIVRSKPSKNTTIRTGNNVSDFVPTYKTFSGHDMVVTISIQVSPSRTINKVIGAFQTITYSIHNEKAPVRVLGNMNVKRYVFGPRTIAGSLILIVFDQHWMKEFLGTYAKIKNKGVEQYFLMDELPAFDLTISCCNEYGHSARMALYGVTIVNEGQVMSVNDMYTENTYQFFATNIDYLDSVTGVVMSTRKINTTTDSIPTRTTTGTSGVTTDESEAGTATTTDDSVDGDATDTPIEKDLNTTGIVETAYADDNPRIRKYEALARSIEEGYLYKVNDNDEVVLDLKNGQKQHYDPSNAAADFNLLQASETGSILRQWKESVYDPAISQLCKDYNTTEDALENALTGTDNNALKEQLGDDYTACYTAYKYYKYTMGSMQQQIELAENALANTYRTKVNVPVTDEAVSDPTATLDGSVQDGEQPDPIN